MLIAAESEAAEEISLVREGGVYLLPVTLNDQMTVKFVIDTGAAETMIPLDIALVLMRTETLSDGDMLGSGTYRIADGSTIEKSRIRLRTVQVGSTRIGNVSATVGEVASPLLLGQNVLRYLEPWYLDTQRHRLVVTSAGAQENHSGQLDRAKSGSQNKSVVSSHGQARRVRAFIEQHLLSSSGADLNGFLNAYAARVDYYDRGRVTREAIRKDKAYYFDRWPERTYRLSGPIEINANADGSINVRYDTSYSVFSPARDQRASGISRNVLTLTDGAEGLRITAETSEVVRRN